MGQREKARAIVTERYEFDATTKLDAEAVRAAMQRAAESTKKMGGGGVRLESSTITEGRLTSAAIVKGLGGLVTIMSFGVSTAVQADGGSDVSLRVGDFLFKKGSLGMKPTINAKPIMGPFVDALKTELAKGA